MIPVNEHFDLREQLRCFLNLIDEHGRRIILKECSALFPSACPDDNIIQSHIVEPFRHTLQHGRLSHLSRTGDKDCTEHLCQLLHSGLRVPSDVCHLKSPRFG